MTMPDGNSAALRIYEAQQDKRQASYDLADAYRTKLVDTWLQDGDKASAEELIAELMARDPYILTLLRRMLNLTAKGVSLGKEANRDALVGISATLCTMIRQEADRVHGDDLVEKEADAIDEHVPCRCVGDCYC